jgi:hypothetical protein
MTEPAKKKQGSKILDLFAQLTPSAEAVVVEAKDGQPAVAKTVLSSDISVGGHICLSLIFVLTVVAYSVLAFLAFFTRPEIEAFSQQPAKNYDAVPIAVEVSCGNAPFCGNITIQSNYSDATTPGCGHIGFKQDLHLAAVTGTPIKTPMQACFVADQVFSVDTKKHLPLAGLLIDFSAINPGVNKSAVPWTHNVPFFQGAAVVKVVAGTYERQVNMESWQVKTLMLGMNVKMRDGVVVSQELYPVAVQYEGKRPNWRATLLINLAPLANVYDTTRPGSVLDVLASIGGAMSLLTGFMIVLAPIVGCISPGQPHQDLEDDEEPERVTNA